MIRRAKEKGNLQNIFRLEVAVNNVSGVQRVQRGSDLCCVQTAPSLRELSVLLQPKEKLAARHEIKNHIQFVGGLKSVSQMYKKGVVDALENVAFGRGVRELVALHESGFSKGL